MEPPVPQVSKEPSVIEDPKTNLDENQVPTAEDTYTIQSATVDTSVVNPDPSVTENPKPTVRGQQYVTIEPPVTVVPLSQSTVKATSQPKAHRRIKTLARETVGKQIPKQSVEGLSSSSKDDESNQQKKRGKKPLPQSQKKTFHVMYCVE